MFSFSRDVGKGVAATVVTNAAVHPLCTVKNRWMAGEPSGTKGLYAGFFSLTLAESVAYGLAYGLTGYFKKRGVHVIAAPLLAGALTSPLTAAGEMHMILQQVSKSEARTDRIAEGVFLTLARETAYPFALLGLAPALERLTGRKVLGGVAAGALVGAATTPIDTRKTRIQAGLEPSEEPFFSKEGAQNVAVRTAYIGLAVAIGHVANRFLKL